MCDALVVFDFHDGINYRQLGKVTHSIATDSAERQVHSFLLKKKATGVRFVRVTSKNIGVCPKGHAGEGKPANLFVSEIVVR